MRDLFITWVIGHGLNQDPECTHVVHKMPSVFAIGVLANRCHFVAWPAPHRLSRGRGRELAVVKELMPDFGLQPSADIVQWPSVVVFLKKQKSKPPS